MKPIQNFFTALQLAFGSKSYNMIIEEEDDEEFRQEYVNFFVGKIEG